MIVFEGMSQDEALTSDNPITRMTARAFSSSFAPAFAEWVNSERERPDYDPLVFTHALTQVMINLHAGIAAQIYKAEGRDDLLKALHAPIDGVYGAIFDRASESMAVLHQQMRRARL